MEAFISMGTFIKGLKSWALGFTLDTVFLSLLIFIVILSQAFVALGALSLSSMCFTASFLMVAVWFLCHLGRRWLLIAKGCSIVRPEAAVSLLLLGLMCVFMALNFLVATDYSLWSLSFFRKAIIVVCVFLTTYLCLFGDFEKGRLAQVSFVCVGALVLWFGLSFFAGFGRDYLAGALTLGYSNPNQTGLVLSSCMVLLLCFLVSMKSPWLKIVSAALLFLDAYLNYLTRCRAGWIAVILCFFIYFLLRYLVVEKDTLRFVSVLSVFIPIAIVGIYLALGTLTNFFEYLEGVPLFGKDLTTRLPVWSRSLKLFLGSPVFGAYEVATLQSTTGISGFQCGFMDILIEQGAIVFVLFLMYYCWSFLVLGERIGIDPNRGQACFAAAAGFLFFSSIFDSGSFLGILGWYVPILLPMALVNDDRKIPALNHGSVLIASTPVGKAFLRRKHHG